MASRRHPPGSWVTDAAHWLGEAVGWAAGPLHRIPGVSAPTVRERPPRDRRVVRASAVAHRRPAPRMRDAAPAMSDAARAASELGLRGLATELSSPDPAARRAALETVGELAEDRAARIVLAALHDPDPEVRSAATAAAARARASAVVFSLILALDDPAPEVRRTAAMAIEEIAETRVELADGADAATRQRVIAELKRWWKQQRLAQLTDAVREPRS